MAKKNLCNKCSALCCRYFALPIENPDTRDDYDDIRWYLSHKGVTVFVEDGEWYVNIKNKCRHLSEKDYKCKNYDKRPNICRGYETSDCDLTEGSYDYDLHFTNDRQMEEYSTVKFGNNIIEKKKDRKKAKRKK